MYKLKQVIENIGQDRVINNDLKVENNIVYLKDKFKFEQGNWYENCGGVWVNTQGGVPDYELETNPDADIFEPEEVETEQDV